ncbi:hypothetical protein AV521_32140 [Streptomyces sp. IMTB 2501]|nr:hypothetical protein AV521_32140 [Streptomyces sp. IMTB 2501]
MHGQAVGAGHAYDNPFVSMINVKARRVTHWRDHLDPVAVFRAVGRPDPDCWTASSRRPGVPKARLAVAAQAFLR